MTEAEVLSRREIYDGKVVHLVVDTVRYPNGAVGDLEVIHHPGAAAMLPLTDDGDVILIRQYRHATGGWLLEIPAGKLDAGEPPEVCADRELAEEIGYRPGRLVPLGWIYSTPGFADEKVWLFLALDLQPAVQNLEEDENLVLERLPLAEAVEKASNGELTDCKSTIAILRAARWLSSQSLSSP